MPPALPPCAGIYFGQLASTAEAYSKDRQGDIRLPSFFTLLPTPAANSNPFRGMPPEDPSHLKIILARVLLGRQCAGKPGLRRAPPGFDSVNGTLRSDTATVVFDNAQAYPAYVVTLSS